VELAQVHAEQVSSNEAYDQMSTSLEYPVAGQVALPIW
jgi:hypothetical protein